MIFVLLALIALLILFILLVLIQTLTPTASFASITLLASLALLASIMVLLIFDHNNDDDIPLGKTKEGVMVYYVTEKRQCVEFIRRYLTLTKGLTFPDVVDANELLHLTTLYDVKNDSKTYNTYKPLRPQEGDIIFMNISKWGHVGVVVHVDGENDTVDIISQNSKDQKWYNNEGDYGYTERMSLKDPLILGWWRADEKMENFEYPTTANP